MLRPPIEPMLARSVPSLPEPGPGWDELRVEPKFDGFRALAFCSPGSIVLQSRLGRTLTAYLPDIVAALRAALPAYVVLDGELVAWEPDRHRTSFALLQRRLTAGAAVIRLARRHPAHFVIFDLLQRGGRRLLAAPLVERRARLVGLLRDAPPAPEPVSADHRLGRGR